MYALLKDLSIRETATVEAVPLTFSLIIAELFYKLHSFTLELLAFLATWYLLSRLGVALSTRRSK